MCPQKRMKITSYRPASPAYWPPVISNVSRLLPMAQFTRSKRIGYLIDLLSEQGVHDIVGLRALIAGKTSVGVQTAFQVLRRSDLQLDDEDRSFKAEFVYERTIFDCDAIRLLNSKKIDLRDCIVLGVFRIGNVEAASMRVYIDTCAFAGRLHINGLVGFEDITVVKVNSPELQIDNVECRSLSIWESRFRSTTLSELQVAELHVYGNELGQFELSGSK